ncbi:MAG: hypothetical protein BWY46_00305 [Firmicutes bacterium ADurb.Bin300]|nr:MAG: hypothetical protein BWY46_00305 [Firmicutes bacterium ADurb.Bin300]
MYIRKYNKESDEDKLMSLIKNEGKERGCYCF